MDQPLGASLWETHKLGNTPLLRPSMRLLNEPSEDLGSSLQTSQSFISFISISKMRITITTDLLQVAVMFEYLVKHCQILASKPAHTIRMQSSLLRMACKAHLIWSYQPFWPLHSLLQPHGFPVLHQPKVIPSVELTHAYSLCLEVSSPGSAWLAPHTSYFCSKTRHSLIP